MVEALILREIPNLWIYMMPRSSHASLRMLKIYGYLPNYFSPFFVVQKRNRKQKNFRQNDRFVLRIFRIDFTFIRLEVYYLYAKYLFLAQKNYFFIFQSVKIRKNELKFKR